MVEHAPYATGHYEHGYGYESHTHNPEQALPPNGTYLDVGGTNFVNSRHTIVSLNLLTMLSLVTLWSYSLRYSS